MSSSELSVAVPGLEIREKIGSGGMGEVFKAYQPALDRLVALKTIRPELLTAEGLRLFQSEARLLARCNHPNTVRVLEFHPEHQPPYFLMEYVDGIPLDQALKGRPRQEMARLFQHVVATVAVAHEHGVVHGDLKPSNLLMDRRLQPHVLDFGLARLAGSEPEAGAFGGTLHYLAPEIFAGSPTGFLSDIYALGVTLYLLLTGLLPYKTPDEARTGKVRLPAELDSDIPEPLQRICLKAMERHPENRYQTAEQMQCDLERFCAGKPVFARPTRYEEELEGRVGNHLTDVRLWQQEGFINPRERDALVQSYQGLLAGDSPWLSETRTLLTGPLLIRVGSWCLLLSSLLWPIFFWDRLGRATRLAGPGVPAGLMAILGAAFLVGRQRRYALACLGSFVLLFLVFQLALFAEFRWLSYPQNPRWEFWGELAGRKPKEGRPDARPVSEKFDEDEGEAAANRRPEGMDGPPLDRPAGLDPEAMRERLHKMHPSEARWWQIRENGTEFLLVNSQLFFATLAATLCMALLMYGLRAPFFAPWLAVACLVLFTTVLLLFGDRARLLEEHVAWVALHYLMFAPVLYALGYLLERRTAPRVAQPFYVVAGVTGVAAAVALAAFGTQEWFGVEWQFDSEAWNLWLMAYSGPLYFWARLTERFGTEGQRALTRWLYLLVPIFVLFPLQMLFSTGVVLLTVGSEPLRLYAVLYLLAVVGLLILGRVLHLKIFVLAALWGLAIWVFRMTFRHFWDQEGWAIAVGASGALLVGLGAWCSRPSDVPPEDRTRRRRPQSDSAPAQPATAQAETVALPL